MTFSPSITKRPSASRFFFSRNDRKRWSSALVNTAGCSLRLVRAGKQRLAFAHEAQPVGRHNVFCSAFMLDQEPKLKLASRQPVAPTGKPESCERAITLLQRLGDVRPRDRDGGEHVRFGGRSEDDVNLATL